jgi:hypothetical protein
MPVNRQRSPLPTAGAYTGWLPFLCVLAAIALLAAAGITWVTSPNWGVRNVIAAPRHVGYVPVDAPPPTAHAAKGPALTVLPDHIDIPAIEAEAPIVKMDMGRDRELEPPLPPTTVGWWTGGARPGAATGTAVIAGHINYGGVAGALGQIGRLNPGDKVIVHGTSAGTATELTFTVTGVRTYSKQRLPWAKIFDQQVSGRLALVTCGGPFDPSTGNYQDNIVAYAVLDAT